MSDFLPINKFAWVLDTHTWTQEIIENLRDDADVGYMYEVDISYPKEIHDAQADYPMCPELATPPGGKTPKLLATLNKKERYVLHYRNLKQALKHGIKLEKIHRILKFNQAQWLKPYIDLNSKLRADTLIDFEKDLYKLMNNAFYGKTMENVRKYSKIYLCNSWDGPYGAESLIGKPNFKRLRIFNENLVAVEMNKTSIKFTKPIYTGAVILELSKTIMYEFHYEFIRKKFSAEDSALVYTDTDSYIYLFNHSNIYKFIAENISRFDTSGYPKNNKHGVPLENHKVLGLMKDETNMIPIERGSFARSKLYSIKLKNNGIVKRAKGIKKDIISKNISYQDYEDCIFNKEIVTVTQRRIVNKNHKLYTIEEQKFALSYNDDKRYQIYDSFDTLPWGHYRIPQLEIEKDLNMGYDLAMIQLNENNNNIIEPMEIG